MRVRYFNDADFDRRVDKLIKLGMQRNDAVAVTEQAERRAFWDHQRWEADLDETWDHSAYDDWK